MVKRRPYWPQSLSEDLDYLQGVKPLYEYLEQNGRLKEKEVAYMYYGTVITWGTLLKQTNRFAGFLKRQGVKKGSCVALYLQNCPQYIIAHFAIQQLGGIVIPLNPMFKEAELAYYFEEAPIMGIVAGIEGITRLKKTESKMRPLSFTVSVYYNDFVGGDSGWDLPDELKEPKLFDRDAADFRYIIENEEPLLEKAEIDIWTDIGLMVFTSGTTGRPKGAMLTFGSALFKAAAASQSNGIGGQDKLLATAPLCHIAGMVMGLNIPVYTGRPCVLFTRFDPLAAVEAIEKYHITCWYSIAPMNWAVLQIPGILNRNLSSLRLNLATSFGIQVTKELAEKWEAVTKGCILYEAAYGLSETHTCDTFMPKEVVKFGSCGIPTYETEIRIINPDSRESQPAGKEGEILVKSPSVFKGYLNRPDATAETLQAGWVHTGDIGYLDNDGYLYFLGRAKEMIKSSGYSIFPEDVEALLNLHPAISQSAVIGIPHPVKGETVKAYVVLHEQHKTTVSPDSIIQWAKETMAAYKYPRKVEIIEKLPATPSGKVLRKLLKEK